MTTEPETLDQARRSYVAGVKYAEQARRRYLEAQAREAEWGAPEDIAWDDEMPFDDPEDVALWAWMEIRVEQEPAA